MDNKSNRGTNYSLRDLLYLPARAIHLTHIPQLSYSVFPTTRLLEYICTILLAPISTKCHARRHTALIIGRLTEGPRCQTPHRTWLVSGLWLVNAISTTNLRPLLHKNDGQERRDLLTEIPPSSSPITFKNRRAPIACSLNGRQPKIPIISKGPVLDFYSHHTEYIWKPTDHRCP